MKAKLKQIAALFNALENMQYGSPLHEQKLVEAIAQLNHLLGGKKEVTLNNEQRLFVIPENGGYTCLGFEVCVERIRRLAKELAQRGVKCEAYTRAATGTLKSYKDYCALSALAHSHHIQTGYRFTCDLTPQLVGLEGKKVKVVTSYGETMKFRVGKSTGWIPIHLMIEGNADGGCGVVGAPFKSIEIIK